MEELLRNMSHYILINENDYKNTADQSCLYKKVVYFEQYIAVLVT
jgi:hypothetical protein